MSKPSREIIENARNMTINTNEANNCCGFPCTSSQCPYIFENGRICGEDSDSSYQFFKDFLAKYDTEESMFKVGDKVRIKDSLSAGDSINGITLFSGMAEYKGMILTIDSVNHHAAVTSVTLKEDDAKYKFIAEMLEMIDMDTEKEIEELKKSNAELKARIAKLEGKKDTYPCIKRGYNDIVVLFSSPGKGMCISKNSSWSIGNYDNCWAEDEFSETLTEYTVKV